jgi:two-component system, chemotaxis family, chemotaxis protein CheY
MVMASLRDVCEGGFAEAGSGLEAIEQLALGPIDAMILDLNMPDMHGLEVLKFMRGHEAYRRIPIVVLTTRADAASRAAVLEAGATAFMTKPFVPQALADQVRALVRRPAADPVAAREGGRADG